RASPRFANAEDSAHVVNARACAGLLWLPDRRTTVQLRDRVRGEARRGLTCRRKAGLRQCAGLQPEGDAHGRSGAIAAASFISRACLPTKSISARTQSAATVFWWRS